MPCKFGWYLDTWHLVVLGTPGATWLPDTSCYLVLLVPGATWLPDSWCYLVLLVLHLPVLQEVGGVAKPLRVPVSKWSLLEEKGLDGVFLILTNYNCH